MATRMQQRRGTYSQWDTANPILNAGEVGWESDFNRFKIGDGINHWQDLPYFIDETALGVTLGDYVEINLLGVADGVAELGGDGKLKAEQMPTTVDNLTITGDLTINGSTTNINTTNLVVEDKNIVLGDTATPTNASANGGGITLKGTTDKEFKYSNSVIPSWFSSENIEVDANKNYLIDGAYIKDVAETLTNKTINLSSNTLSGTTAQFNTALSDGSFATLDGSETLTNKTIHNATFTGSQTGLQLAFNQTLVFEGITDDAHEMTLSAGDPTTDRIVTLPDATGTIALVQNKLSDFAATTSAEVASVVSDETGTGSLVFSDSATLNNVTISGATISSLYLSDSSIVIEGTANDHETTLTVANPTADRTITFPDATGTVVLTTTVDEMAQDAVNTALVAGTGIDKTYDDVNNTITLDIDSTVTTNSGAQTLTNKTLTLPKINDGADVTANSGEINILDGATLTTAELNILDGATLSTAELNILDGVTATTAEINILAGATLSTTELNYVDGVTSAIQSQIDSKASLSGATFTGSVEIDQDLTIDGNLTVNGTTFNASSTSIVIEDNMVQLAHNNAANTVDLGLVVGYNDGAAKHAGIVRDVSANKWKLFKGVTTEPATTVDFTQGSLDDLELNALTASSVTISGTLDVTGATITGLDLLPSQSGNSGKYLTTDGTTASWGDITATDTVMVVMGAY